MLKFAKKTQIKDAIIAERKIVDSYKKYELGMKETVETYVKEFKNVSFDNDALKTMLLNNFENSIMQLDNNLSDIDSLSNVLDILDSQKDVTKNDAETYNKLAEKSNKDIELTQNFLKKTVACFENITLTGKKKSITILEDCKKTILADYPFEIKEDKSESSERTLKKAEKTTNSVQKNIDYSSSDLLCFFPKDKNDNLVISTVQDDYKISFKGTTARIFIEDENFNIALATPGVQISNTNTNNILFVTHVGSKYTIITNNQMEIPPFIQISKISKNEDFLEVEISRSSLNLVVEDNVISFEEEGLDTVQILDDIEENEVIEEDDSKVEEIEPEKVVDTVKNDSIKEIYKEKVSKKAAKEDKEKEDISSNASKHSVEDDGEIVDNDTLIISDENKKVILPYKLKDLEQKLQKNKNYKTLKDVVDKEYTIPMETFKNPVKSRFREAFQLIKKKEHGSLKEAISLGFELMFQSDLNPAVIAACKDLDELDIYLDCLDDNELDKFSCFKIQYNVPPSKH